MRLTVNNTRYDKCPICQNNSIAKIGIIKYTKPIFYSTIEIELSHVPELWKCKECGSWFTQNIVSENDSHALYSTGSSIERWGSIPFKQGMSQDVIGVVNKYLKRGLKVLDIGCGQGALIDYAAEAGCKTYGVEYSKEAVLTLEKRHTMFSSMEEINEKFDIIFSFSIIEHHYHFNDLLNFTGKKLNPNGKLIILTGDNESDEAKKQREKWWYVSLVEHIIFPAKKTYELNKYCIIEHKNVFPFSQPQYTLRGLLRKGISLLTSNRKHWPFPPKNHYIIVLEPTT
jgi:SAM-dependent methyltransferase